MTHHANGTRRSADVAEDVDDLLRLDDPNVTTKQMADRLRMTPGALTHALRRAGRVDLSETLTRNSRRAGASVTEAAS